MTPAPSRRCWRAPGLARSDPATAERAVMQALDLAPDDVEASLAAYRFYFYNHRLAEALPRAATIVVQMAHHLNIATDWRLVRPGDAAFSSLEEASSLYLQALLAWGYGGVRLGGIKDGRRALEKGRRTIRATASAPAACSASSRRAETRKTIRRGGDELLRDARGRGHGFHRHLYSTGSRFGRDTADRQSWPTHVITRTYYAPGLGEKTLPPI
jgi:hypothetical protein